MIKARNFKLELTIVSHSEEKSASSLTKSTSISTEGSAVMHADNVRKIIRQLCELLVETLSDSEIEKVVNN